MLARTIAGALAGVVLFLSGAWGAIALLYQLPGTTAVRIAGCVLWSLGYLVLLVALFGWRAWWAPVCMVAALAALIAWWLTIRPSNDRVWADDVARLLSAK